MEVTATTLPKAQGALDKNHEGASTAKDNAMGKDLVSQQERRENSDQASSAEVGIARTFPLASRAQEETSTSVPFEENNSRVETDSMADRLRQGLNKSQSLTEVQYHPNRQVQATQPEDNPKTRLDTYQAPQRGEDVQQIRDQLQDQQVSSSSQTNSPPLKRPMHVRTPSPSDRPPGPTRY